MRLLIDANAKSDPASLACDLRQSTIARHINHNPLGVAPYGPRKTATSLGKGIWLLAAARSVPGADDFDLSLVDNHLNLGYAFAAAESRILRGRCNPKDR
jgi:hypothetical protein